MTEAFVALRSYARAKGSLRRVAEAAALRTLATEEIVREQASAATRAS